MCTVQNALTAFASHLPVSCLLLLPLLVDPAPATICQALYC